MPNPNREWWDEVTPRHLASSHYDVAGFMSGRSSMSATEVALLGSVAGRRVLHPMCHIGLDTLSIARLGATVVGLDFSPIAIRAAQDLARQAGLESQSSFVVGEAHRMNEHVNGNFDVVYTSTGVLEWLDDLAQWSRSIATTLAPGGRLVIFEIHPFSLVFDELPPAGLRVANDYFGGPQALTRFDLTDYVDRTFVPKAKRSKRLWRIDQLMSALLGAGLRVTRFEELPFSTYPALPVLTRGTDGLWHFPPGQAGVPLYFSLQAEK